MTPNQKLADLLLGQPVTDWINQRREQGKSWRAIRDELAADTNNAVDVQHETVRSWAGAA